MNLLDARFAAYLAVATLLIVTPGPDTALVTRNALVTGRRAVSFTVVGIALGSVAWALASVLGIAVLLEQSVVVFTLFKYVGAAYLGYLGVRGIIASLRSDRRTATATSTANIETKQISNWGAFRQGLVSNLLNPKAGAIFATALPQFISPGDSPVRLLLMMLVYEAILLVWLNLYGYLISRAGQSRVGTHLRTVLGRLTGVVLIALGVRLALEKR
ncbi:MAG TPA: LysE family translocator [Ktedonobacteraceae bacterium]|nr:LysE family translocator [Ktedonobacteraceae bacterium]